MWNPVTFAVYNNKLDVVSFLFQSKEVNPGLALQKNPFKDESQVVFDETCVPDRCFGLELVISSKKK